MKSFHCHSCGMMVFFENSRCVKCDSHLGFLPDVMQLSTLEPEANDEWRPSSTKTEDTRYRNCANGRQHKVCNWMVPATDPNPFCTSCRLNEIIPDLSDRSNFERWERLERAKRRCIYTFLKLGLPLDGTPDGNVPPLSFRFLQDQPNLPVQTGHEKSVITINIAEADADEREHRRITFHEPYRTLLGHFRHESGHFFWDRLIANSPFLDEYRKLFGDERADYDEALKIYYQQGPAKDWSEKNVTAYASSHPWEDWAETWAHYLHIMDTLETAASFGLNVRPEGTTANAALEISRIKFTDHMNFDDLITEWTPLTCALNSVNRGMGLSDLYPFVISPPVVEKLRFIHKVTHKSEDRTAK